jgi:hypothetical protein
MWPVPDRLRGELGVSFPPETGETCHVVTGGGVSHELPDADRRRCPPPGGVPIINWTWAHTQIAKDLRNSDGSSKTIAHTDRPAVKTAWTNYNSASQYIKNQIQRSILKQLKPRIWHPYLIPDSVGTHISILNHLFYFTSSTFPIIGALVLM